MLKPKIIQDYSTDCGRRSAYGLFMGNPPQMNYLQREHGRHTRIVSIMITICALVAGIGRYQSTGHDWVKFFTFDEVFLGLLTSFAVGVLGSMFAAYLFLRADERHANSQISRICSLSDAHFLETLLNDLTHFESKTCTDFTVDVSLTPILNRTDLILVSLSYSYKKSRPLRHLRFKINRITSDSTHLIDHNNAFFSHECYFHLDERSFVTPSETSLYTIEDLVLNNRTKPVLTRINPHHDNIIEIQAEIPNDISLDGEVAISYRVAFPMEAESLLAINIEVPTKRMHVKLDYTTLHPHLEVSSQSFISRCFGPNPMHGSDGNGKMDFQYGDWLLPKNGVAFAWWKK